MYTFGDSSNQYLMPGRRKFISTLTRGFAGSVFLPGLAQLPAAAADIPFPKNANEEESYWKSIRSLFPLDKEIVYLNSATMGPSPNPVIQAETAVTLELNSKAYYPNNTDTVLTDIARFVKAHKANIVLTHNVTEGINIGVWSLNLQKGDEVIISTHEHVGNAVPWLNRAKHDGIILKPIALMPTAAAMIQLVEDSITPRTKVIALPHIPCTNGQVLPLQAICALARQKNIRTIIDGAHGPGLLELDLPAMDCDMYVSCCHKWMLGPKGTGFMYIKNESLEKAIPKFVGAYSDTGWDMLTSPPKLNGFVATGHKFFYGTQSPAHYAGIIAAIKFHQEIGLDKIEKRTRQLAGYLQKKLMEIGEDKIDMLSPTEEESRGASIAFNVRNQPFAAVQSKCVKRKFVIRGVPENGINCLRVSTHIYNNYEQIDAFADLIKSLT